MAPAVLCSCCTDAASSSFNNPTGIIHNFSGSSGRWIIPQSHNKSLGSRVRVMAHIRRGEARAIAQGFLLRSWRSSAVGGRLRFFSRVCCTAIGDLGSNSEGRGLDVAFDVFCS